jgi:glycerophosphoryl diester phosphodiesterase
LGAFQAACAAGYGIELDVQLSADGEAMVFHDDDLARMTGASGRIGDRTTTDLAELKLNAPMSRSPRSQRRWPWSGHRAMVHIEPQDARTARSGRWSSGCTTS